MACYLFDFEDTIDGFTKTRVGFMCGDADALGPPCACGRVSDILCDFPVGNDKTCDRPLCERCAHKIGNDIDYCPDHADIWREFCASGDITSALARLPDAGPVLVNPANGYRKARP